MSDNDFIGHYERVFNITKSNIDIKSDHQILSEKLDEIDNKLEQLMSYLQNIFGDQILIKLGRK